MLHLKVSKPTEGSRWVIGDVHGCSKTLKALIGHLNLTIHDQLFFLGDYIDRGPDSAGVLDFLMELKTKAFQVYAIRGNHEQEFIENYQFYTNLSKGADYQAIFELCLVNKTEKLLDNIGKVKSQYWHFMTELPFYIVTEDFYFVHAGFAFHKPNPFQNYEEMIWIREFEKQQLTFSQTHNRRVVVGHTIHKIEYIRDWVLRSNIVLPIDNGCFLPLIDEKAKYNLHYGNLCALNLDDYRLVTQRCLD